MTKFSRSTIVGLLLVITSAGCQALLGLPSEEGSVTDAQDAAHELTAFAFLSANNPGLASDVTATISGTTLAVTVPFGTNVTVLTGLTATFSTTGATVTVAGTTQVSGVTANDFTNPVVYRVTAVDGSTEDYTVGVSVRSLAQEAYIKASNTGANDRFGARFALSSDGNTLAVGADFEDSAAIAIGGSQADNTAVDSGAVYVFTRAGPNWIQQAYIKASNTGAGDNFGTSVSLSADGNTLAVAARFEDSAANGVGGNQADNTATDSGAVYVFTRAGTTWTQQAYVKASNTGAGDQFGQAVALSGDGNTLAVAAHLEDSAAIGVGGNQADNTTADSGAVYVFTRAGVTWTQQAYVKASNTGAGDIFGSDVALSADGNTLAIGVQLEDSAATGVGGNQADNTAIDSGAAFVFTRVGVTWTQQAYVKASNTDAGDNLGSNVSVSADGSTLALGAHSEASGATGVDGNQADNSVGTSGAAYVFNRTGTTWTQQAYIKASNTGAGDQFGVRLALSADGSTLAVGAYLEDSAATGVGGNQADNTVTDAGAVYVFTRAGTIWTQQAYVKASNTGTGDQFCIANLALSSDGTTLVVAAIAEDSASTGVGGNQADESATDSGAVYAFQQM